MGNSKSRFYTFRSYQFDPLFHKAGRVYPERVIKIPTVVEVTSLWGNTRAIPIPKKTQTSMREICDRKMGAFQHRFGRYDLYSCVNREDNLNIHSILWGKPNVVFVCAIPARIVDAFDDNIREDIQAEIEKNEKHLAKKVEEYREFTRELNEKFKK